MISDTREHLRGRHRAGLKDLMARMGHDSERPAMIYQHEARGTDAAITGGIDAHVQAERGHEDDGDGGAAGGPGPCGLMAHQWHGRSTMAGR